MKGDLIMELCVEVGASLPQGEACESPSCNSLHNPYSLFLRLSESLMRAVSDSPSSFRMGDLSPRGTRSPIVVSGLDEEFAKEFEEKYAQGEFLGELSPIDESLQRGQFARTAAMGRFLFMNRKDELEPKPSALNRTKAAAKQFFSIACQILEASDTPFPLANKNKCLGMVAVPNKRLVIIAISQDKDPTKDEVLRQEMARLLVKINQLSSQTPRAFIYKLGCIPTKSQYLMPRTFFGRTEFVASLEHVTPSTRCVEVSLMAALNKCGRFNKFTAQDTGIIAFGGTLWASPDLNNSDAIGSFAGALRNDKYTTQSPIDVSLPGGRVAYVDIWDPCKAHCEKYKYPMLAIGASGGSATSFLEPIFQDVVDDESMRFF